jgi:hypothetical protein
MVILWSLKNILLNRLSFKREGGKAQLYREGIYERARVIFVFQKSKYSFILLRNDHPRD